MGKRDRAVKIIDDFIDHLRLCPAVVRLQCYGIRPSKEAMNGGRVHLELLGPDNYGIKLRIQAKKRYEDVTLFIGPPGRLPDPGKLSELKRYLKDYTDLDRLRL